jgi:hypothetical protein
MERDSETQTWKENQYKNRTLIYVTVPVTLTVTETGTVTAIVIVMTIEAMAVTGTVIGSEVQIVTGSVL